MQDPALAREHFLSVASYNLQHPARFTTDAVAGLRDMFVAHLDGRMAVSEIRRPMSKLAEGEVRVLKPEADRVRRPRAWSMTIDAVTLDDQPVDAAKRVREWAMSIRSDLGTAMAL